MPNYLYKCTECESEIWLTLPISSDPQKRYDCEECGQGHGMSRRIVKSSIPKTVGHVWAGDWFKQTYGHDMADVARQRAREKMEYDAEKLKLEQDGVKITHRSRQVGGKDRISIPDKKED